VPLPRYLHLASDEDRLEALAAARSLLRADGRLVFDVFAPSPEDVEETHARWIEREPGIEERADWDLEAQTLTLSVRGPGGASTMVLAWLEPARWHALLSEAGFEVTACYGWFDGDRTPAAKTACGLRMSANSVNFCVAHPCAATAHRIPSPLQRARNATRSKPWPSGSTKKGQP